MLVPLLLRRVKTSLYPCSVLNVTNGSQVVIELDGAPAKVNVVVQIGAG